MSSEAVQYLKRVERAKEHSSISTSEGMIKEPDTFYINEVQGNPNVVTQKGTKQRMNEMHPKG